MTFGNLLGSYGRAVPNLLGGLVKSRYTILCIILINFLMMVTWSLWSQLISDLWSTDQLNWTFKQNSRLATLNTARIANEQWASLWNEFLLLRLFGSFLNAIIYIFFDMSGLIYLTTVSTTGSNNRITWYEYLKAYYLNFNDVHDCVITFTTIKISCIKGSRANLWSNYRHFIFF